MPIYDAMGNVHGMIKASDGSLAAAYEYDAFGNTLRESGTYAASNPFRFSTKYTDIETGLVYYGHRFYSPSLGRFISRDPKEESGGRNLYAFLHNNAINSYDYLGWDSLSGFGIDEDFVGSMTGNSGTYSDLVFGGMTNDQVQHLMIVTALQNTPNRGDPRNIGTDAPSGQKVDVKLPTLVVTGTRGDDVSTMIGLAANRQYGHGAVADGPINTWEFATPAPNSTPGSNPAWDAQFAADTQPNRLLATNDDKSGYWDRYVQHVETYSITPPPAVTAVLLGGGAMPKVWVPWTAGRLAGSVNPLTSVLRGLVGSNPVTTAVVMRQFVFPTLAISAAAVGGYNTGVLLSGFVYAAFPGSNALPPPPPPPPPPPAATGPGT